MINIIIFGYAYTGTVLARKINYSKEFNLIGFADNSVFKQGNIAYNYPIRSVENLKELSKNTNFQVIIAARAYREIIEQLNNENISVYGIFDGSRIIKYPFLNFDMVDYSNEVIFYAGDIYDNVHLNDKRIIGLSINKNDDKHILHDIRKPYPIPDNSIDGYEAEAVLGYIDEKDIPSVLHEIKRILKPGAVLRICIDDYNSPFIKLRAMRDKDGKFLFDAGGGGDYREGCIINGGIVYHSTYENLSSIINNTGFSNVDWLCYYTKEGKLNKKTIDNKNGFVNRLNNGIDDYCMIVDCVK